MPASRYIQVLLPLKLNWEPVYSSETESAIGDRVRVEFGGKEYVGIVTKADAEAEALRLGKDKVKPVLEPLTGIEKISEEELTLWQQVAYYYLCSVGEVYKAAYPEGKVEEEETKARIATRLLERLARKEEQIARARREDTRERYEKERDAILAMLEPSQDFREATEPELSTAQSEAYSSIKKILESRKPALLRGVTGSGKTEIYLKLASDTLAGGRNVLFMVPEIALSRQLEDRIRTYFPSQLKVFHSAETASSRAEAASFIRESPYLVLGTRSSIFLPHRNLGLIIVDEENDPSYKQDNPAPRYNGREAAIMLAGIFKASIVLGSATPSLESLYNCSAGRFGLVNLKERYFDAPEADVEIIDTIAEKRKNGMIGSFSRKLIDRINDCLSQGGQIALLRERRSYSPVLQCEECGHILKCSRCDAALSLHKREDGTERLVCHYCGKVKDYNGTCTECGGQLKPLGSGTQKIEEEAKDLFPKARIARLDSDSSRSRKHETEIIRDFAEGHIDILIGTRMVAKGFDFSGLSLVAVIQSDSLLGQQDYKADERALQLLEQFRGRCGRRSCKGLFVIQTSQPGHPVYKGLTEGLDANRSISNFLSERKLFGYPPYSRVINAVLRDRNQGRIGLMGRALADSFVSAGLKGVKVIGPYSPPVDRVNGEYIRIIRLLLPKDIRLKSNKATISKVVETLEKERKYTGHISLDVDPV